MANDFMLVFLGDNEIPVTLWAEGTTDIHVPNLYELGVAMRITQTDGLRDAKGYLLGTYLPTIIKNPKVGQKVHLKVNDMVSLPLVVRAVYKDSVPENKHSLLLILRDYHREITNTKFFTSVGENHIYLQIIKFILNIFYTSGSTSVSKKTLLERAKTDESLPVKDIRLFLKDLIDARIFKDEKDRISPEPALYYILIQAINRMHTMSNKPFSNTD